MGYIVRSIIAYFGVCLLLLNDNVTTLVVCTHQYCSYILYFQRYFVATMCRLYPEQVLQTHEWLRWLSGSQMWRHMHLHMCREDVEKIEPISQPWGDDGCMAIGWLLLRQWSQTLRWLQYKYRWFNYSDVIMVAMSSLITSLTIVYSIVYSGTDERKHQRSASLAFVRGIHRSPVNSPHKGPVTRKMFPFDDVIM